MSNEGKNVKVHYRGTLDDGTEFDSSYSRNEPLAFKCMTGQMIAGFDAAVKDMEIGQTVNVRLEPKDAYGESDPSLFIDFPADKVPNIEDLKIGDKVFLRNMWGQPQPAVVCEISAEGVKLDLNHEMAGKTLNYEITLLEAN